MTELWKFCLPASRVWERLAIKLLQAHHAMPSSIAREYVLWELGYKHRACQRQALQLEIIYFGRDICLFTTPPAAFMLSK